MPHLSVNDCRYFYVDTGVPEEHPEAQTVVFGHGFLMTHRLFEKQVKALEGRYRCLAFDWRGQGRSQVTTDGYGLWNLVDDAAAFIETLGLGPCHYVGHSMGGYVGFRLALRHPALLKSLALVDTQAGAEPLGKRARYYLMLFFIRLFGYRPPISKRVVPIMFGPDFRNDPAREAETERWRRIAMANDRRGVFRTGMSIFARADVRDRLAQIGQPTLLLVGEDDRATPPSAARDAYERLRNAELTVIPHSGHSAPIEQPDAVNDALTSFLDAHTR